jgi:LacI family transcriptional regulator
LGHRNTLCVSYPGITDGKLRLEQYQECMQEHGVGEHINAYLTFQSRGLATRGREIFSGYDDWNWPTAIYTAPDTIAIGLLRAAFQVGIKIPAQVSLVGFDNIDITPYTIPPRTTINRPALRWGRKRPAWC